VKVSENLGATSVALVALVVTTLILADLKIVQVLYSINEMRELLNNFFFARKSVQSKTGA
jgi:hypothetical protein